MKKIIFIELLHHHECLENPYLTFKKQGFETKAVLGEFVAKKLKNISQYEEEFFILPQPVRSHFSSLNFFQKLRYTFLEFIEIYKNTQEIKKIIQAEKPEAIYINTIESPFLIPLMLYLLGIKDIKIHLTIHSTNRLKVHFLKYFLFDFLIQALIKKAYKIILLGEYLRFTDEEIQKKVMYVNNRIIKETSSEKFKKITFVVSGNLDYKNKDLKTIFMGFGSFLKQYRDYEDTISLVLLGQINNKVASWIETYRLQNVVKTFDHYVGEKDMEKYMSGAHYSIISTYKDSLYGKYKISGAFGDAVGFNLPILLSENYAPDYQSDEIIRFKDSNLHTLLRDIIVGPKNK